MHPTHSHGGTQRRLHFRYLSPIGDTQKNAMFYMFVLYGAYTLFVCSLESDGWEKL